MSQKTKFARACLFAAALSFTAGISGKAMASDPLPGDAIAPPVNVNIGLVYNQFNDAGALGAVHGSTYSHDTHISTDITVLRYVRTFDIDGVESGVQAYVPYVAFLGHQQLGLETAAGPSKASLSAKSGFGQPNFGAFFWPVNDPVSGTYVVVGPWISPPVSGFNKSSILNPGSNTWVYEMEVGARTTLLGTPKTQNLQVEVWGEIYGFGNNTSSAANNPFVTANNLTVAPGVTLHNFPIQQASSANATFREQTSEEVRVYFPYNFAPAMGAFIAPGFYQSFGGKQTYKIPGVGIADSGNRTNESQLRLVAASFINPTTQILLFGGYDVANHGGPLNRSIEIRLAHFF